MMFSGGVAEYVYGREDRDFGDMGKLFGAALRKKIDAGALPWPLLPPGECIRATAIGASEYSVQLSGNTTYISNPGELLPRRNLQVLQPAYDCENEIVPEVLRGPSAPTSSVSISSKARPTSRSPCAGAARLRGSASQRWRAASCRDCR